MLINHNASLQSVVIFISEAITNKTHHRNTCSDKKTNGCFSHKTEYTMIKLSGRLLYMKYTLLTVLVCIMVCLGFKV